MQIGYLRYGYCEGTRNSPVETGLYYLNARYYDPEVGRFISPDSVDFLDPYSINGLNIYAYCVNNSINKVDPSGHFGILAGILLAVGIIGLSAAAGAIEYQIWNSAGWISIDEQKGDFEIKHSWLLQNPISNLNFLNNLRNSSAYQSAFNNKSNQRGIFDLWLEWEGHNIASNLGVAGGLLLLIPSLLTSNGTIDTMLWKLFNHGKDAYFENDKGWWKIWEKITNF